MYTTDKTLTAEEKQAITDEFTVGGSCGCDGYYDNGCPACSPAKRREWLAARKGTPVNIFD